LLSCSPASFPAPGPGPFRASHFRKLVNTSNSAFL
jgi:hypothetical protein